MAHTLIVINKSTNPFSWYSSLVKKVDETSQENVYKRTFNVTLEPDGKSYKTIDDVAGPNVKGFINVEDVTVLVEETDGLPTLTGEKGIGKGEALKAAGLTPDTYKSDPIIFLSDDVTVDSVKQMKNLLDGNHE